MAATSLGAFGAYKWAYSRHAEQVRRGQQPRPENEVETVWVTKRYIPTDLRATAPVPRHKFLAPSVNSLPRPEDHWVPVIEPSLKSFCRDYEETNVYKSQPSSRCEEWSTLRQMLPSRGSSRKSPPPNWGTGSATAPNMKDYKAGRFPCIGSPMTRYVDAMHKTNSLFKLY